MIVILYVYLLNRRLYRDNPVIAENRKDRDRDTNFSVVFCFRDNSYFFFFFFTVQNNPTICRKILTSVSGFSFEFYVKHLKTLETCQNENKIEI